MLPKPSWVSKSESDTSIVRDATYLSPVKVSFVTVDETKLQLYLL